MINEKHFLDYVIRPVIISLSMGGLQAEILLLGTALAESNLTALIQYNNGPALGLYQQEPTTHKDIWDNYLRYHPELTNKVKIFMIYGVSGAEQIQGNLYYATVMARLHYRRVKQSLPLANDPEGMSQYHKDHYNTNLGKANPVENVKYFERAIKVAQG